MISKAIANPGTMMRKHRTGDGGDTGDTDSEKVLAFPVDALPGPLARLVEEGSKSIGCPPDLIALPLLVAMASAIGNSRVLHLKDGWQEKPVLWGTVIANPGEKKSPAASLAFNAPWVIDRRLRREYEKQEDEYKQEMRKHALDVKENHKNGLAAPPDPQPPVQKRTTVDDTTLEALMPILQENPRGIVLARDELSAWVKSLDQCRNGKGSDRQTYLSLWSSGRVTVDRKGNRESIAIESPFLSLYGTIQPDVLPELGTDKGDGMLDRFLLSYPEPVQTRWTDEGISNDAKGGCLTLYGNLRSLKMESDEFGDPVPGTVRFSPEAKDVFVEAFNRHREEMEHPGFANRLRGPWAKLESYFARIILLLTMMRCAENGVPSVPGVPETVEPGDVLRARVLLDYFKSHAHRVYGHLGSGDHIDELAKHVADALEKNGGTIEGQPQAVLDTLRVLVDDFIPHLLPDRPDELTKNLLAIAKRNPSIEVHKGRTGRGDNKRRTLKVFLTDAVPTVPNEGDED